MGSGSGDRWERTDPPRPELRPPPLPCRSGRRLPGPRGVRRRCQEQIEFDTSSSRCEELHLGAAGRRGASLSAHRPAAAGWALGAGQAWVWGWRDQEVLRARRCGWWGPPIQGLQAEVPGPGFGPSVTGENRLVCREEVGSEPGCWGGDRLGLPLQGLTLENGGRGPARAPVGTPCSAVSTSGVALPGAGVLG